MSAKDNDREDFLASNKHSATRTRRLGSTGDNSCKKVELTRISSALKKEDFRKMVFDYCSEIQNPESRKRYEAQIQELEAERGVDVQFVSPEPGFVVKGRIDGGLRCYVNVAKSSEAGEPRHEAVLDPDMNPSGLSWTLPLARSPPRDDIDSHGRRCVVYDVLFHADAVYLAQRNEMFRKCIIDTALDAVERDFKVKIDRMKLKYPKEDYKGLTRRTAIRRYARNTTPELQQSRLDIKDGMESINTKPRCTTADAEFIYTIPKYTVKYVGVAAAEVTTEFDGKSKVSLPHELVIEIELPLLKSTTRCQLDVTSNSIYLLSDRSNAKYRLRLDLPCTVNDKRGTARFDVLLRCLRVTLPVVQTPAKCQQGDTMSFGDSKMDEVPDNDETFRPAIIAARLSPPVPPLKPFLKRHVDYLFPTKFDCNVLDDLMSVVLHVRNVQQESIALQQRAKGVHVQFRSIGTNCRSTPYAFYMQLPENCTFEIQDAHAEAWESNVVLNLNLSSSGKNLQCYLAGIDAGDLKDYAVQEVFKVAYSPRKRKKTSEMKHATLSSPQEILEGRSRGGRSVEIQIISREQRSTSFTTEVDEEDTMNEQYRKQKKKHRRVRQQHKIMQSGAGQESAESGCHLDMTPSTSSCVRPPPCKGILKHYSRYDPQPCISESSSSFEESSASGDTSLSDSLALSTSLSDIPEEHEGPLTITRKKTVRFNETITKKIFCYDSAIYEQCKKTEKICYLDRKTITTQCGIGEDDDNNQAGLRLEANEGRHLKFKTINSSKTNKRSEKEDKDDYYYEEDISSEKEYYLEYMEKEEACRGHQISRRKSEMSINQINCENP